MEGGINSNSINILFIFFFLCVQTQNDDVAPVNIGPDKLHMYFDKFSKYMCYNAGMAELGRGY